MIYKVFNPIPALAEIVEYYWYSKVELDGIVVHHYPAPLLQGLAFNFKNQQEQHEYGTKTIQLNKQAYFFGQPTCGRTITNSGEGIEILGVKFTPLGIVSLTGINMENMADSIISADNIWGTELDLLCEEMQLATDTEGSIDVLEIFFLKKYAQIKPPHHLKDVANALSLIKYSKGKISIGSLQYETNTSRKTLERAFANCLGVTPKLYSEITRFNAAKEWLDNNILNQNLSTLAFDFNYCDGSHLSAEFKRFAGMSPSEYLLKTKFDRILAA